MSFKVKGFFAKASLISIAALSLGNIALAADSDEVKRAQEEGQRAIVNLNSNFNSFETNKDYENFISSRSKLLARDAQDKLSDVDVNAQATDENSVQINKFNFVSEDGVSFPIIAKIQAEADKFAGQKFSVRKIAALKNNLNNILIRSGYTTSIIYIPDDSFDNKSGTLTQYIKWGKVNTVKLSDESAPTYKNDLMLTTLPSFNQGVLRIDTVDQIVENLTTVNKQVRVDVAPTPNKPLYTDLVVTTARTSKPVFNVSFNNANDKNQLQTTLSAQAGDLIGTNDAWTFSYTTRLAGGFSDKYLHVLSARLDQPLGFFNLSLNNTLVKFKNTATTEAGNVYIVRAPSFKTDAKLSYNLFRDKVSITNLFAGLAVKHGYTDLRFKNGANITFENKNTTDFRVGANYLNKSVLGGTLFAEGTYTQGLGLFSGNKSADPNKVDPKLGGTDFAKTLSLYANYNKNFNLANDTVKVINLSSTLSAQKSLSNRLIGYDTTVGDAYMFRGLRTYTFSGDDSVVLSTNVGPVFNIGANTVNSINPYVGLDLGAARYPAYDTNYTADSKSGASLNLGATVNGTFYRVSGNLGKAFISNVKEEDKSKVDNFTGYFNVSFNF